jgi:SAM-dependent methyltransferase
MLMEATARQPASCAICRGPALRPLFERNGEQVWRCRACGVRFLHPQPSDAVLQSIYTAGYFFGGDDEDGRARTAEIKTGTAAAYLDRLRAFRGAEGGRLLEVGCGDGWFLATAQARGFDVRGAEISTHAVEEANRRLGGDKVDAGSLEEMDLGTAAFDVVVCADVVEHVREPLPFLRRLHATLRPGGALLIVTPSLDSWSARALRRYWMEYKVEHLFYFGRRSLRLALRAAGFEEPRIESNRKVLTIDYVARHFDRYPVPFVSPLIALGRLAVPSFLALRPLRIPASGMAALARRPAAGP